MCKVGLAVALASGLAAGPLALAKPPPPEVAAVGLAQLPAEAQSLHRSILAGGPFPYPKDGIVFGNRERLLPSRPRGRYREYTVKTPGSKDRGARRIVCEGDRPAQPITCFYTDNHYASFSRIQP